MYHAPRGEIKGGSYMTYKSAHDAVFAAENACLRLQAAVNALEALHDAMQEGPNDPGEYVDGLFCLCLFLGEETARLHQTIVDAITEKETPASA